MSAANDDSLQRLVGRCGTCRQFRRAKWHEAHGGGEQHGGYCKLICAALKLTNTVLIFQDEMYVMETFGCYAHSPNKGSSGPTAAGGYAGSAGCAHRSVSDASKSST